MELDPFQVAVFQLSGGTTGVPKIIPRFNNEYLYTMRAVAAWLGYRAGDILFMPQPLVHNLNMACCFGPFLMTGGTVTVAPDLLADTLVSLIKTAKPTWLMLGGPIVARLDSAIRSAKSISRMQKASSPPTAQRNCGNCSAFPSIPSSASPKGSLLSHTRTTRSRRLTRPTDGR